VITSLLKARFRAEVPREVTKTVGELIIERYGISADEAEIRWLGPEATDATASMRRADIETGLTRLRGLFPGRIEVETVFNVTRNARHREAYCAGWALTQSKIEHETDPLPNHCHSSSCLRLLHETQQETRFQGSSDPPEMTGTR
jgi:hypothetical protein